MVYRFLEACYELEEYRIPVSLFQDVYEYLEREYYLQGY